MNGKNAVAILLVFCCLFGLVSCRKLDANSEYEKVTEVYVVGDKGEQYTVQTTVDAVGETQYYYNDDSGNTVTLKTKENTNGKTEFYYVDNSGSEVTLATKVETIAVKKTTASAKGTTGANGSSSTSDISLTPEQESFLSNFDDQNYDQYLDNNAETATLVLGDNVHNLNDATTVTNVQTADGLPLHDNSNFFNTLAQKDKYTLKFTMKTTSDGQTNSMPVTIIKSGNNMYMEMSMPVESGDGKTGSMTCFMIVKNGSCRAYIPNIKGYFEVPADEFKEMQNEVSLGTDKQSSGDYKGTTRITLKGVTYDVDIYDDDGTTVYYYYSGSTPKRIESKSSDGEVSIIEYDTISYTADETKFKYPSGYFNMTDMLSSGDTSLFSNLG